jgi:hypothetical protein
MDLMNDSRLNLLFWAAAFVLGGLFLLLFNFDVFAPYEPIIQYIAAGLLLVGAVAFFGAYLSDRHHWWRLIPAWTLVALAGMIYLSTQRLDGRVTAALLFVGLAVAFAHIYLLDRGERWWAIIPGGFMLVLAGVLALSSRTEEPESLGTFLFTGMGLVFFLLYGLGGRRQWWALIPGTVLVLFGLFVISVGSPAEVGWLRWWPLLLVLVGLVLGWRAYTQRSRQKLPVNTAPSMSGRSTSRWEDGAGEKPARGRLGEYREPAPGSSVEVLPDPDEEEAGREE